jgi:hypothetical protein
MTMQLDMIQVVHPGASQAAVVEGESARLDHVDRQPETGGEAQDRAGILRDVGLIERKPHGKPDPLQIKDFSIIPAAGVKPVGTANHGDLPPMRRPVALGSGGSYQGA